MMTIISVWHKTIGSPLVVVRGGLFVPTAVVCLFLTLAGCGGSAQESGSGVENRDKSIRVEPDTSSNAKNIHIDPLRPPGSDERPARTGETGRPRNAEGLPLLEPKGIRAEDLFRESIDNTDQRIKRLENAVVEIRRDLDAALPAINRLVAIEGDIQELVRQLQTLTEGGVLPPSSPVASGLPKSVSKTAHNNPPAPPEKLIEDIEEAGQVIEPLASEDLGGFPKLTLLPNTNDKGQKKQEAEKKEKKIEPAKKQQDANTLTIDGVRMAAHNQSYRIVIENKTPIELKTDFDSLENLLIVDLPKIKAVSGVKTISGKNIVKSYRIDPVNDDAARVIFELNGTTKIRATTILPPTADNPNYRGVIDLEPAVVPSGAAK